MPNFLLFFKKRINVKLLVHKLNVIKFLGKFIPYFKPMAEFTEEKILEKFDKIIYRHFMIYNNVNFSFTYFDSEDFNYENKSCEIIYKVVYKKLINFKLHIKVRNQKAFTMFSDIDDNANNIENAITDIFMFIQYFKKLEDIDFFRVYMDFAKEKK